MKIIKQKRFSNKEKKINNLIVNILSELFYPFWKVHWNKWPFYDHRIH